MRALALLEMYTSADLAGVSLVNTTRDLYAALAAGGRQHYVQYVVPPRGGTYDWPDGYFASPWSSTVEIGDDYPLNSDSPPISARLGKAINPGRGRLLYDYVLNEKFFHAATLSLLLWTMPSKWRQTFDVPILNWYWESTLDRRLPLHATDQALALLAAGTWVSDTLVMNEYDAEELERQLARFLPASQLQTAMSRTHVVRASFDANSIDARREGMAEQRRRRLDADPTLVVLHGGSFERKRRIPKCAEVVAGIDGVRMLVTTQHGGGAHAGAKPLEDRGAEVRTGVTHDGWLDTLWEGDIVYCGAEYEGTGLAYMEAIRAGLLPVGYAEPWIASRLPDDYPLLGDDLTKVMRLAVEDYERLHAEWSPRLIEAMEPWSALDVARAYDHVARTAVDNVWEDNLKAARHVQPAFGILGKALESEAPEHITDADDVYELLTRYSDRGAEFRYVSPLALSWMLRAYGYRDRADRPGLSLTR